MAPRLLDFCLIAGLLSLNAFAENSSTTKDFIAGEDEGKELFEMHCVECHSGFLGSRAPSKQVLGKFPPRSIVHALTTGVMRTQGYPLNGEQRRLVAEYLTGKKYQQNLTGDQGACEKKMAMPDPKKSTRWNGWGNSVTNASYQSSERAGITAANVKQLELQWVFGFPDAFSAWAQPVIASNRIFVGSQAGIFYSLSTSTGCTHWQFTADAGVRGAASIVEFDKKSRKQLDSDYGVLFGDMSGNAYALDAETGRLLWKVEVDSHPKARVTGSPVMFDGKFFVPMSSWTTVGEPDQNCCTFRGSITALDVNTGKQLWKTYTIPTSAKKLATVSPHNESIWGPSGSAIWSPPAIDAKRRLVIAGTGNSYTGTAINSDSILALDMDTGDIRWSTQLTPDDIWLPDCQKDRLSECDKESGPNFDIASPPMMITVENSDGGKKDLLVVGQKSGVVYALDPENEGKVAWQHRVSKGGTGGGIMWGSAYTGTSAYFPISDITAPEPGGISALNVLTGEPLWFAKPQPLLCGSNRYGCNAAQPVGIAITPEVLFAGSVDGGIRAYSRLEGELLWTYDTNREFNTVNGVLANGGSLIGSGPTIADGMLFVNSGYGTNGGRAGNALLAFSINQK